MERRWLHVIARRRIFPSRQQCCKVNSFRLRIYISFQFVPSHHASSMRKHFSASQAYQIVCQWQMDREKRKYIFFSHSWLAFGTKLQQKNENSIFELIGSVIPLFVLLNDLHVNSAIERAMYIFQCHTYNLICSSCVSSLLWHICKELV